MPVEAKETVLRDEEFLGRENDEEVSGEINSEEVEVALGSGVINDGGDEMDEGEDGVKEENRIRWRHWGLYIWLYILYFLYYGLANRALEVFNCNEEPITRTRYLQQNPWLECSLYVHMPPPPLAQHALLSLSLSRSLFSLSLSLSLALFLLMTHSREDLTYLTLFIMAGVALGVYVVGIPV